MTREMERSNVREAVAVFDTAEDLQEAVDELMSSGFDRAELSLLAGQTAIDEKLGHRYRRASELEDDPAVPRQFYVSTEAIGDAEGWLVGGLLYVGAVATAGVVVASGGTLAAILTAASLAGGAGGLIGAALAKLVVDQHAHYLQEQIDRGGLLLWVRTWNAEREKRATEILGRHSGHDVHVHALPESG
jgi:hypothetical protein